MKLTELAPSLAKYRRKGVLIDTNLLLLYVTGLLRVDLVESFKPLTSSGFTTADFNLLSLIVSRFDRVVTTPHVMTELSNHADKIRDPEHDQLFAVIRSLVAKFTEQTSPAEVLCQRKEFIHFGLADTAICAISKGKYLVLTVDFPLYGELQRQGIDVINFNHLRGLTWNAY